MPHLNLTPQHFPIISKREKIKIVEPEFQFGTEPGDIVMGQAALNDFLTLIDTPSAYTDKAGKYAKVNSGEDALEFSAVSFGGSYGMNVETLSDDKTLTPDTDEIYQYLDPDGSDRTVTLATSGATAGDRFVIRHTGSYNDTEYIEVKQSTTSKGKIYAGSIRKYIFDGTDWVAGDEGTGDDAVTNLNVAIGMNTQAYDAGVAIGGSLYSPAIGYDGGVGVGQASNGNTFGVGVGTSAQGYDYGVGIGYSAGGEVHGVAIGAYADTNQHPGSVALGHAADCQRACEIAKRIEDPDRPHSYQNNITIAGWYGQTGSAVQAEIFLAEIANERFTIPAKSVLTFRIYVTAMQADFSEVAAYEFIGVISRDDSDNTTLNVLNKTILYEDDAAWDATVEADDTNEALIIKVTGAATTIIQWTARLDGIETSF